MTEQSEAPQSRFSRPGHGWDRVGQQLIGAAAAVADRGQRAPLPIGAPEEVLAQVAAELGSRDLPAAGIGEQAALDRMARIVHEYGLNLTHELCAAHLQPPPLSVAVAADALASATNASLDTYDSGPATLAIESWTVEALARLVGLPSTSGGVFGPGGSYSNLLAMLIARDQAGAKRGIDIRQHGVSALGAPVVLCSKVAHFSVQRACAALGLGESAVITVDCDSEHRMLPSALEAVLDDLASAPGPQRTPFAVVATAGTTDFGTVDPLPEIAEIAHRHGLWLHVDAAYGFGALFSDRFAGLLAGIELADSITLDLHKVGWQPAAASLLLLADTDSFSSLDRSVAYLNPEDDLQAGFGGQLGLTLQTTRRPDVLKVATTLLAYGRSGLGDMLDACHDLARHAQERIDTEPQLELVSEATLTTVVFRYLCDDLDIDQVNAELRRRLISSGTALIGRTQVRIGADGEPRTCLKLTLLNPETSPADIGRLFDEILRVALEVESEGLPAALNVGAAHE
ncbi:putative L-2,4-diaminobutyrate decarboxylase [Gordonia araii NBRC 100433]|uniref:Putative L-2,4-diaminobutyrate decarboxylase n=1 Tax=Gordonia araii NBRC 100433 TaxID=1073574 RepID=G7GX67_9ACTN|nr:pyridoxal-dependent decarboxylase [Gordonia araii]NNG98177.1 aminotransferase class V-fold PLP-dependent enzyme [Gordonia araii NBRC 100433]GAB08192.1 putative L-2,4-diaminobutyrate decarboxylase [Gordonia araii NBRC 100433]